MKKTSTNFNNTAIVFSGGSVNGFCYLGVLKYLEEHNIEPVLVGGTSAGSLFASIIAAGYTYDEAFEYSVGLERRIEKMKDYNFSSLFKSLFRVNLSLISGIVKGNKIHKEVDGFLARKGVTNFSDFKSPFFLHTVNIENGDDVLISSCNKDFDQYKAADWIRASISMPGVLCPAKINGTHYVDGASRSNYPILSAAKIGQNAGLNIDKVISVSIEDNFLDNFNSTNMSIFDILSRSAKLTLHDQYHSDHEMFREKHPDIELIEVKIPRVHKVAETDIDVESLSKIGYDAISSKLSF